jgi:hypothetical protein
MIAPENLQLSGNRKTDDGRSISANVQAPSQGEDLP